MKKKLISLLTVVGMMLSLMLPNAAFADTCETHDYDNGICTVCGAYEAPSADESGVYQIGNAGNLYWFAQLVNGELTDGTEQNISANAVLTADIDLNPEYTFNSDGTYTYSGSETEVTPISWTPIGTTYKTVMYQGTFDGADHTISGLYIGSYSSSYCGLFGYSNSGTIKNIKLDNSYICSSKSNVGGICGYNSGTITNCSNAGTVSSSLYYVGGICGFNPGTITNCSNAGTVSGNIEVGGICGGGSTGTTTNCSNIGKVSGEMYTGGVCGQIYGKIANCYYLTGTATEGVGQVATSATVDVTEKSADQYASGEVCYLLNGDNQTSPAFGQLLGGSNADAYPVFYDGTNDVSSYTDDSGNTAYKNHSYTNGICSVCRNAYETPSSDEGGTYQIKNAGNLYWFAQLVNGTLTDGTEQNRSANAVLTADIDLNPGYTFISDGTYTYSGGETSETPLSWTPIGASYDNRYTGTFDGADYTISGLYIGSYSSIYCGLFGFNESATIKNIKLDNSYICSSKEVLGGICGQNIRGTIENCSNAAALSGSSHTGGVCGDNYGTITNCSNAGTVSSSSNYVGGICGGGTGTITNCSNAGTVSSSSNYVGGIEGSGNNTINNCYNTGSVSGYYYVGGISGYVVATVSNCYNTGSVSGRESGGICGVNYGTITNCYSTGSVSGYEDGWKSGGVCGDNYGTITNCYSTGSVPGDEGGGICGLNDGGTITNCYYLSGTAGAGVGYSEQGTESVTEKTATQYASGEVCYLLNADDTPAWYQNISTTEKDEYPVLDSTHKQVYSNAGTYSNIEVTTQTSSQSEDADKGDYAYGYVTNINTNDCTVSSLIWNVSAADTYGNKAEGTVTYDENTSNLNGNIKVGLILTKRSDSIYTIKSVSAYVE